MSSDVATLLNLQREPTGTGPVPRWVFTSSLRQAQLADGTLPRGKLAQIPLALNPKEANFEGPRRITKQNTHGGSIIMYFADENEEANDLVALDVTINTGSIDERDPETARRNLSLWHNLFDLARERELLDDGTPNYRELILDTPAMPFLLILQGYFEKAPDPRKLAAKPSSMDVTFRFIVTTFDPPIREWTAELARTQLGGLVA